jgi:hypothetical protein
MKTRIKALAVILAGGAILQAIAAYANPPSDVTMSGDQVQCDELREKVRALIERERHRNRFEAFVDNPALMEDRLDDVLRELDLMTVPGERVEPGP